MTSRLFSPALITLVLLLVAAPHAFSHSASRTSSHGALVLEFAVSWICDRADNICGLDDPKMLSSPAKIDYDEVLKATPEMKKMRDDKIDPNSSEGIQLRQKGVDRVREKCDAVRTAKGYCSVWKTIRHQDGRVVPDITDQVKAQL
jgi:hypothetical protein